MSSRRIHLIDSVRGFCVLLMIAHHLLYDLVVFLKAPSWFFSNPVFNFLHYIFAGVFILLSGISSRFSRSNVKRGLIVVAAALAITLLTALIDSIVVFGILHLLGFCMIFYGLTHRFWERFEGYGAPACYIVLTAAAAVIQNILNPVQAKWLWIIGFYTSEFYSGDYFPILPWIFVFLLGTWLGGIIRDGRLPGWIYKSGPSVLSKIGRKSFVIYLVHQPVLYGLIMLIKLVFGI